MTLDDVQKIADAIGVDVRCSSYGGMFHVIGRINAGEKCPANEVGERCSKLLHQLADGKIAFIRQPPRVDSYKDFERDELVVYGYTRFSFSEESGSWVHSSDDEGSVSYGAIGAKDGSENDQVG